MTRDEIKASCERARLHIERHGIGCSPITAVQRARFEELRARRGFFANLTPEQQAAALANTEVDV
ncbi:MAG: hypothetical protein WBB98_04480 [Xanthobacteraceae bacterium]